VIGLTGPAEVDPVKLYSRHLSSSWWAEPVTVVTGRVVVANADTFTNEEEPDVACGSQYVLRVSKPKQMAYLKFDLTAVSEFSRARLRLCGGYSTPLTKAIACRAVADTGWEEGALTWTNQPAAGTVLTTTEVSGWGWYEWDITSYVKAAHGKPISVMLTADNSGRLRFASRETGTPPQLVLEPESKSP
jgi:hypothetical protein